MFKLIMSKLFRDAKTLVPNVMIISIMLIVSILFMLFGVSLQTGSVTINYLTNYVLFIIIGLYVLSGLALLIGWGLLRVVAGRTKKRRQSEVTLLRTMGMMRKQLMTWVFCDAGIVVLIGLVFGIAGSLILSYVALMVLDLFGILGADPTIHVVQWAIVIIAVVVYCIVAGTNLVLWRNEFKTRGKKLHNNHRNNQINTREVTSAIIFRSILASTLIIYYATGWAGLVYAWQPIVDATIKSLYAIIIASALYMVFNLILVKSYSNNQRSNTIVGLLKSLNRYVIAVGAIIFVLAFYLGENYMTELIAGLGVLTLVIGFGCQTLISDIVAGIFMVFEGHIQVGDYIEVNSWTGKIIGIGLRTTVLEDIQSNHKIINNSLITEVVNNSSALSYAICILAIEYGESVERVEKVIIENLEKVKEKVPAIVEGPTYLGVDELADSSVNLRVVARCKEEDKYEVNRRLNREFKLIFDANNINFPFPQLTLSNLD